MNYQHLIIEGADGTGKSTLAKRFESVGFHYIHADKPTTSSWTKEYVEPVHALSKVKKHIVMDRWHIGEIVWPTLFNRRSIFASMNDYDACCEMLYDAGCLAIIVVRSANGIESELLKRGEHKQVDLVIKSQQLFVDVALKTWAMDTLIIDSNYLHEIGEPWKLLF